MQVNITINCDNAAFENNATDEVARILKDTANRLIRRRLYVAPDEEGGLYDENGNRVGDYRVTG